MMMIITFFFFIIILAAAWKISISKINSAWPVIRAIEAWVAKNTKLTDLKYEYLCAKKHSSKIQINNLLPLRLLHSH